MTEPRTRDKAERPFEHLIRVDEHRVVIRSDLTPDALLKKLRVEFGGGSTLFIEDRWPVLN